jgi:hypothetical protein
MRSTGAARLPAVLLAIAATCLAVTTAAAAPHRNGGDRPYCAPAGSSANTQLSWRQQQLAPGITLLSSTMSGPRGKVAIRAVRADLDQPGVGVGPLHREVSGHHVLTSLARGGGVVAATNGMYFDLSSGAPILPLVQSGRPVVLSAEHTHVAGIGVDNRPEDGGVWLTGTVRSGSAMAPLVGINDVVSPAGVSVYTRAWGSGLVPLPSAARSRAVTDGRLAATTGRMRRPPRGGELLVARGGTAVQWLRSLAGGAAVTVSSQVSTNAPVAFEQAYGVGTQTVSHADQTSTDIYCSGEYYAARTDIAWSRSRTTLLLVTAESPRGPDHYGLDQNEMSGVLLQLRAADGYALDGGASTTMVARALGRSRFTLESAPHGDRQRPIPVGIGIYYRG